MQRSSGMLLPIFSLPSPYGIGTLGKAAYACADFLKAAGQKYWQMLPLGPTSFGDSPYQSFSTYAGNPYFIDLDLLCEEGLLQQEEIDALAWGNDPRKVDYATIYENRFAVLRKAFLRGRERDCDAQNAFAAQNPWLANYALFMALKKHFSMLPWTSWPDEAIRRHQPDAVERYRAELSEDAAFYAYLQFLFFRQWTAFRGYVTDLGIKMIGDLPIYVAMDSADVWAEPESFQLDETGLPTHVSGVPPDYFSADGQLWGNPLYNWERMKQEHYAWWIRRIGAAAKLYDVVRIDHFRGLESYWSVPYGETTAIHGEWIKGPGMDLVSAIKACYPDLAIIAEDLGYLTPAVLKLVNDSGFPGMKVLQFAFDSREPSNYLPHTYPRRCVCYTGTHDNTTAAGWMHEAAPEDVGYAVKYLGLNPQEGLNWGMIRGGMSSVADLFVAQIQDYLGLDSFARMNIPSTVGGNWQWRLLEGELSPALAEKIASYVKMYGR